MVGGGDIRTRVAINASMFEIGTPNSIAIVDQGELELPQDDVLVKCKQFASNRLAIASCDRCDFAVFGSRLERRTQLDSPRATSDTR